ncbi:MAG: cation:proton antiporter [Spirochaetia bacterium]|nr:cation:proton antiporter [Spirochaetia bacterium]
MHDILSNSLPNFMHFENLGSYGSQLAIVLGIALFFGTLGGHFFQKLHVPQVVGYFIIGIIIGNSGLQLVQPEVIKTLNPISVIALAFIGFLVGGELKTDVIKKMGAQFVSTLLFEAIVPAIIVSVLVGIATYIFTGNIILSFCFGIILGAICSSTAPEATTNVLQEYRSRGPMTSIIYGLVAMDDAVALILFAIASTVAAPLLGGHATSFGMQMLAIAKTVFGSIGIGLLCGVILVFIIRKNMNSEGLVLSFTLGILLLCTGFCNIFGLNNILATMATGFFVTNFSPKSVKTIFPITNKFTPPVYVLFFVVVGAKIDIWGMKPFMLILAALYIIGRTTGKAIGSWFGAFITKAPVTVQKYLKYCLLSQAGVAIGLSITSASVFGDIKINPEDTNTIGDYIVLIVTFTTFFAELIGPVFVKMGITKAGEAGMNVSEEDIKKNSKVKDVTWGTELICSEKSNSIVKENDKIAHILNSFESHHNQSFAVIDLQGNLIGTISLEHLKETLLIGEFADSLLAIDIMEKPVCTCPPELMLPDAYERFDEMNVDEMPIVDKDGKVLGMLEKFAVDHYIHSRIIELHRQLEKLG